MARKKRDGGGGYSWMDTYGDMVTLLLTFFIMLFSMSTVNEEKWKVLVQAFSRTSGAAAQQVVIGPEQGDGENVMPSTGEEDLNIGSPDIINEEPVDLNELYEFLMAFVEQNKMEASVQIEQDEANNVYISFDNSIFFDGDSSVLRHTSYPVLDFMGKCLKAVEEQILMTRVIGHTAFISGSAVNDWELSAERASNITTYFEKQLGLDTKKLKVDAYGSNAPIDTNDTPEGRAKNRRVQIMVMGNNLDDASKEDLINAFKRAISADIMVDPVADAKTEANPNLDTQAPASQPAVSEPPAASEPPATDAAQNTGEPTQGTPQHKITG